MSLYLSIYIFLFTIICYIRVAKTVVPEYCLQPLNADDCGLKPTVVMTYWKPGSRCEVDIWRGCPTANKFDDEYNCSTTCIFRAHKVIDECGETMDDNKCTEVEQAVYTFQSGLCVPTVWRGCPTLNKFINRTACISACAQGQWQDKLENMPLKHLKQIDNILNNIVEENVNATESVISSNEASSEEHTATGSDVDDTTTEVAVTDTEDPTTDDLPADTEEPTTEDPTTTISIEEVPVIST